MRIFGGERVKALMFRLGMTEGVPIESGLISRRIENAQKSVEAQNFDARKHLLEYDDVMNKQREAIYAIRRSALEGKDQRDYVLGIAEDIGRELVDTYCARDLHPDQWNTTQLLAEITSQFGIDAKAAGADPGSLNHDQLSDAVAEAVTKKYEDKEKQLTPDLVRWLERRIILDVVDGQWKDHLLSLDHLKEGIGLRGYGQKDPLVEFKKEAFILFEDMMARVDNETIRYLYNVQVQVGENPPGAGGRDHRVRWLRRPARLRVPRKKHRRNCRRSRAKWNASSNARRKNCNIRRARLRRKRQSRFAPERKSGAMIHVPAAPARNIKSVTA